MTPRDRKLWIYVAGLALVIAALWAAVSAYSSFHKSTIPADVLELSQPLNPTIDPQVIDDVKKRVPNYSPANSGQSP